MLNELRRQITPPLGLSAQDELVRIRFLLNVISLLTLFITVGIAATGLLLGQGLNLPVMLLVSALVVLIVSLTQLLLRRNRVRTAALFFIGMLWVIVTYAAIVNGGVRAPNFPLYIVLVLGAGVLLGRRQALAFLILSLLSSALLLLAELQGWLPPPATTLRSANYFLVIGGELVAAAGLLYLTLNMLESSLSQARAANAQLEEASQILETRVVERTQDLALAADVGRVITRIRNLDTLLSDAAALIRQRFNLYYAQVYLVDELERTLLLRAGTGSAGQMLLERRHRLPIGPGSINGTAAANKEAVLVADTQTSSLFLPNPLLPATRAEVAVPLLVGGRVVGVLNLQSAQPGAFTPENLPAFEALAGQLAVAIENARLFAEAEEGRAALEAQARRLSQAGWRDYLQREQPPLAYLYDVEEVRAVAKGKPDNEAGMVAQALAVRGEAIGELAVLDTGDGPAETAVLVTAVAQQLSAHLENLRLVRQAESSLAEAEALYAISADLNQTQSYDDILAVVREHTQIGRRADIINFAYFDRPWTPTEKPEYINVLARWTRTALTSPPSRHLLNSLPASAAILRPDAPTIIEDVLTDPRLDAGSRAVLQQPERLNSVLFAPLVAGEQWVGYVGLFYRTPTQFPPAEVRRLMSLVGQAAVTGQTLFLLDSEQRQRRSADILARVARRLTQALGEGPRRRIIAEEIFDLLHPDTIQMYAWQPEKQLFHLVEQLPAEKQAAPREDQTYSAEERPDLWEVFVNGRSSLETLPANGQTAQERYTLPWWIGQALAGVITLQRNVHITPIQPEEQRICLGIVQQGATAIQNAHLLEETQHALAKQELLSAQLRTVSEVGRAATTLLDLDSLLQAVVDLTKRRFNLYHVHIYLLDAERKALLLRAGSDEIGRIMVLENRQIGLKTRSIVARAAREKAVVVVADTHASADFMPHPLLPATRSEMAVPLLVGNEMLGVLDVQAQEIGRFTADDILIQQTLASQVAVAVQNAALYTEQLAAAAKLREVDRLKTDFLASMSHELRTPLNAIIGFADVLLAGIDGDLNDRMRQDVTLIRNSGDHLRELIGDILDMSKIEAGRMELHYEQVDVPYLLADVLAAARISAAEKRLVIEQQIDAEVDLVWADRTRLRQVLWNIVGNAIKFTRQGTITISVQSRPNVLFFAVRDRGIGIRPENLALVFEQFRQVDTSKSGTTGGTGLGMPISKRLIEMHGGEIGVESTYGAGSTFWFTIPK